jgi:hypothetical protein
MWTRHKEKLQSEYKGKYESLKSDITKYLSPIISYFKLKKDLDDGKLDNTKKSFKDLLDLTEKDCHENLEKIEELLKDKYIHFPNSERL